MVEQWNPSIDDFYKDLKPKPKKITAYTFIDWSASVNTCTLMKCTGVVRTGEFYYMYVPIQEGVRVPKEWQNRYIVLYCYNIFPSKEGSTSNPWKPTQAGTAYEHSTLYRFFYISTHKTEAEALKRSRLHLFRRLIDDNNYFNAIPKINELIHWHNGIINYTNTFVHYELNPDPDKWWDFKITYETIFDPEKYHRRKMLIDDHCAPYERKEIDLIED